jgi:hypothetical protein
MSLPSSLREIETSSLLEDIIRLDIDQLTRIFEQLVLHGATFIPGVQAYLRLNNEQIRSLSTSPLRQLSLPEILPPSSTSVVNTPSTVETLLRTSPAVAPLNQSRINREFLEQLASVLGLKYDELAHTIQSATGTIPELTQRLNDIFMGFINPPLTQDEVRELVILTLPASK